MAKKYEKWRELIIDPFSIKFNNIKLLKIISYPPAGNDVIECECIFKQKKVYSFIKIERSKMADFDSEYDNLTILNKKKYLNNIPKIYDSGLINKKKYIVLEKIEGERLSDIFKNKISKKTKNNYLFNYGKQLGTIHNIPINEFNNAKQRIINDYPKIDDYKSFDNNIKEYIDFLIENKPLFNMNTFIHGDFHYGNLLWHNEILNGIIDFEYSGKGFKEQDIAWACILRPTQLFMDELNDIECFINGYLSVNKFDFNKFKWCLINGYCHFYLMNISNKEYIKKVLVLLKKIYCYYK